MFSLFPKQPVFFDLFDQTMVIQKEMVDLFSEFSSKFSDFENYAKRAKEIEKKGDHKAHEVIGLLNKTFITPFDREDIYDLAHELDNIIDLIENVIHNIHLYNVKEALPALPKFALLMQQASQNLQELMKCLREQKHTQKLADLKIKIHSLEDDGDELFANSLSELFTNDHDAIHVIKVKDILQGLENVMDHYQAVSNIIEGIVVKSS